MTPRTALLIIDAQNDFCDLPEAWCLPGPQATSTTTWPG